MDRMARLITTLLKAARAINAITATLCIFSIAIGLLLALYFQSLIWKGPDHIAVPPEARAAPLAIGSTAVDDRLKPPSNIRVSITRAVVDETLKGQDILGYLQGNTANGLARFPAGVDILGGRDSALFDRRDGGTQGTALVPTPALIDRVQTALAGDQIESRHEFALVLVARDSYGIPSEVTNVDFALTYAHTAQPTKPPAQPSTAATTQVSELVRLAREIALAVGGQEGSATYQRVLDRALREPTFCGTGQDDNEFVGSYRKIFDHARQQITATNLPAFLDGICEEWRRATAERAKILRDGEAARRAAISANEIADYRYAFEAASAWAARNLTLIVVGSALGIFTVLCVVLAFLALENHSNAMREAMSVIAQLRREERR
jgi:hypothetical protein